MATSASLGGGFTLVFNGDTANPSFQILGPAGPTGGPIIGRNEYPLRVLVESVQRTRVKESVLGTTLITFEGPSGQLVLSTDVAATVLAALGPTALSLVNQAKTQQTTDPQPPPPGAEPTPEPQKTPAATPDTTGPSESFSEAFADLIDEPETTTDPSILDDDFDDDFDAAFADFDDDFDDGFDEDFDEEFDEDFDEDSEGNAREVIGRIDWRVKLSLAPDSDYFYKNSKYAGILEPLLKQKGVVFPYTPNITVNYLANYEPASIVHSNYKVFQYSNSYVDTVTITCDFTAQDDKEAKYMLAVIHFFKSMTKMFYGTDQNPRAGTPPPLCYLRGMGTYQFRDHPLAITSFSYALPNDVDYISTTGPSITGFFVAGDNQSSSLRLPANILPGGEAPSAVFPEEENVGNSDLTWVPSKIQMTITGVPVVSRNDVSNNFSLEDYSSGIGLADKGFW
jgi:hypothetical protein